MREGPGKAGFVARLSANTQGQPRVEDGYLIALAKQGHPDAYDRIVRRYYGFVRLKASSYFLAGGDADDLIQEGLVGLYKAVRDYRTDRESSFRNFAELCITRQIITAVKTATRNKHTPLNQYVSFSSTPAGGTGDSEPTLDEVIPGSTVHDPVNQVISSEELRALVACISTALSELESRVLDRRQRAAARQAQGRRAPHAARGSRLARIRRSWGRLDAGWPSLYIIGVAHRDHPYGAPPMAPSSAPDAESPPSIGGSRLRRLGSRAKSQRRRLRRGAMYSSGLRLR
jgi:RNA polymerase sporulation-specific sigma factor